MSIPLYIIITSNSLAKFLVNGVPWPNSDIEKLGTESSYVFSSCSCWLLVGTFFAVFDPITFSDYFFSASSILNSLPSSFLPLASDILGTSIVSILTRTLSSKVSSGRLSLMISSVTIYLNVISGL